MTADSAGANSAPRPSHSATADERLRAGEPGVHGAPGLWQSLLALFGELPGLVSDRVRLVALEVRRAGEALALVIALAVAVAILLITAWLALWAGAAFALIDAGLGWGWVLLIVLAINLGAAFLAFSRARSLLRLLGLPATLRRMTVAPRAGSTNSSSHERPPAGQQPIAS